ncbi:MAG: hypothetical protein WBB25_07370 [Sulfitobacter sp.]
MNGLVLTLIAILAIWMLACAWCGFRGRFRIFAAVLLGGLVANQLWMMIGLSAKLIEPHVLLAQVAASFYAISALGAGWLAGRVARLWRASRVEDASV